MKHSAKTIARAKRRLAAGIAFAAVAIAPLGVAQAQTMQSTQQSVVTPANDIVVSIGRGQLVTVNGRMADIFIANEAVADVQVKSTNQIYVFGKTGGETTVYASDPGGNVIWSANVRVGSNIDSIDQMLQLAMPEAQIATATMNNTVLLTGTVAAPEDAAEAERLVAAFVGPETNVISRLKLTTPLQVNLQVKFAEVSRSLVRALGANLTTKDTTGGFKFGLARGRSAFTYDDAGNVNGFENADQKTAIGAFIPRVLGLDIAGVLDAAETVGLVSTLSQPNLTPLSGETADFLAGGEFPIPISSGLGSVSIEYKNYGVSLAYTPTVLSNGRISIRVRPEVSELSAQGAVTVEGFDIPALTTRRAETTVELGSGQSFMIAGLLSNNSQSVIEKTPGVGDLPILGNLFRSNSYRKGETELVIVVTPYLVEPVDAKRIALPTDGFRSASELERLLLNKESDGVSGASRPMPTGRADGAAQPAISAVQPRTDVRTADAADAAPGFSF